MSNSVNQETSNTLILTLFLVKGKDTSKGKYLVDFEGKKFDELTPDELEQF